jgi:hypothetical protein
VLCAYLTQECFSADAGPPRSRPDFITVSRVDPVRGDSKTEAKFKWSSRFTSNPFCSASLFQLRWLNNGKSTRLPSRG